MYLAAVLFVSLPLLPFQAVADPTGHWEGRIHIPDHELGISVDLAHGAGGDWVGSMSVTLSTAVDVPLEEITVDGPRVRFTAALPMRASFTGTIAAGAWSGTASSSQGEAPADLARTGEAHVKIPPPSSVLPKNFEGRWEGTIDAQGKSIPVALKFWTAADGTARGTLTAATQDEIPLTTVRITDGDVEFESRAVSGIYRGKVGDAGEIVGEWTQASAHVPLTLHRSAGDR